MTFLFEITNFFRVMTLETSFSNCLIIFIFLLVNKSNLSTHFGSYLDFPQLCLTSARGIKGLLVRDACSKSICAIGTNIFKHLQIYLLSFQILKVRQYGIRVETKVG